MKSKLTTLCYIEKENCYLMLHRVKKEQDINKNKWIGVGGHFEEGESPEDCLLREVFEETGLILTSYRFRGIVTFCSENYPTEYNSLSEGHYSPSGWNNRNNMADYAPFGFVTAYGSSEPGEDIAEVTACYLTWTTEQWAQLKAGAGDEGWAIIQQKITIVKKYMKEGFGLDMDNLRTVIDRRCAELQTMDLTELP